MYPPLKALHSFFLMIIVYLDAQCSFHSLKSIVELVLLLQWNAGEEEQCSAAVRV